MIKDIVKWCIRTFYPGYYSGIIRHEKCKFIFIHINKTGGTSIAHAIGLPKKRHLTSQEVIKTIGSKNWEKAFKFSVVRNPWDKVVSHYKHRVKTNQSKMKENPISFKDWIKCTYGEKKNAYYYNNAKMFQPQVNWLKDERGNIQIDRILRFESLQKDFSEVAEIIGVNNELPHLNRSEMTDFRDYYDDESIEIIAKWFEEDIKVFRYSFS